MANKDLSERCRSEHFGFLSISVNVLHASVLALSFNKLVYGYIFLNQSKINVFSLIFLNFVLSHQDTTSQVFVDLSYKWSSKNAMSSEN